MATLTVRNIPDDVCLALWARAGERGTNISVEVRAILQEAVLPEGRLGLGTLLYAIGRRARLTDEEVARFSERDKTPAKPFDSE